MIELLSKRPEAKENLLTKALTHLSVCYFLLFSVGLPAQVLIVNPQNPVSELSRNHLRTIFAMRTPQWPDGTSIQVFVFEDNNPLHIAFCKKNLAMFPYQLRQIWDRQVFSGTGIAPIVVKTEQEMQDRVANTVGAIGYITQEAITSSVKALEISP
jgi:ABC-type phosphate transport system substrate-binding protein